MKRLVAQSVWDVIRKHLEAEKTRIREAIGAYPTPIAGCDQQFNHLLEQRTEVSHELARLDDAETEGLAAQNPVDVIEAFIRSSNCIDAQAAESIRRYAQQLPNTISSQ